MIQVNAKVHDKFSVEFKIGFRGTEDAAANDFAVFYYYTAKRTSIFFVYSVISFFYCFAHVFFICHKKLPYFQKKG